MAKKNQSSRLTTQHLESQGVVGIFGEEAKKHDKATGTISHVVVRLYKQNIHNLLLDIDKVLIKKRLMKLFRK